VDVHWMVLRFTSLFHSAGVIPLRRYVPLSIISLFSLLLFDLSDSETRRLPPYASISEGIGHKFPPPCSPKAQHSLPK